MQVRHVNMRWAAAVIPAALVIALVAGCSDDNSCAPAAQGPDLERTFVQLERLGNPLVSEVTLAKREHGHHNAVGPAADVAAFTGQLEEFVTTVAGRSSTVSTTLSSVLLPDELVVDTSKDGATAGWLSWALASGWGGRKLEDDVVDAGLAAIFGTLIEASGATPGLSTDNVDTNDVAFLNTFPYLAAGH